MNFALEGIHKVFCVQFFPLSGGGITAASILKNFRRIQQKLAV